MPLKKGKAKGGKKGKDTGNKFDPTLNYRQLLKDAIQAHTETELANGKNINFIEYEGIVGSVAKVQRDGRVHRKKIEKGKFRHYINSTENDTMAIVEFLKSNVRHVTDLQVIMDDTIKAEDYDDVVVEEAKKETTLKVIKGIKNVEGTLKNLKVHHAPLMKLFPDLLGDLGVSFSSLESLSVSSPDLGKGSKESVYRALRPSICTLKKLDFSSEGTNLTAGALFTVEKFLNHSHKLSHINLPLGVDIKALEKICKGLSNTASRLEHLNLIMSSFSADEGKFIASALKGLNKLEYFGFQMNGESQAQGMQELFTSLAEPLKTLKHINLNFSRQTMHQFSTFCKVLLEGGEKKLESLHINVEWGGVGNGNLTELAEPLKTSLTNLESFKLLAAYNHLNDAQVSMIAKGLIARGSKLKKLALDISSHDKLRDVGLVDLFNGLYHAGSPLTHLDLNCRLNSKMGSGTLDAIVDLIDLVDLKVLKLNFQSCTTIGHEVKGLGIALQNKAHILEECELNFDSCKCIPNNDLVKCIKGLYNPKAKTPSRLRSLHLDFSNIRGIRGSSNAKGINDSAISDLKRIFRMGLNALEHFKFNFLYSIVRGGKILDELTEIVRDCAPSLKSLHIDLRQNTNLNNAAIVKFVKSFEKAPKNLISVVIDISQGDENYEALDGLDGAKTAATNAMKNVKIFHADVLEREFWSDYEGGDDDW